MIDERGKIETIATGDFKCVQLIESKKGSIRSNHFHRKGGHRLYVLSGKMIYRECAVVPTEVVESNGKFHWVPSHALGKGSIEWDKKFEVKAGESVFTGPWIYHQTEFLEDTVLISCAITPLDHEHYEADTVRLGTPEMFQVWCC
jgi:quercetin dioxygenase-like cupin family protein